MIIWCRECHEPIQYRWGSCLKWPHYQSTERITCIQCSLKTCQSCGIATCRRDHLPWCRRADQREVTSM